MSRVTAPSTEVLMPHANARLTVHGRLLLFPAVFILALFVVSVIVIAVLGYQREAEEAVRAERVRAERQYINEELGLYWECAGEDMPGQRVILRERSPGYHFERYEGC